ncbi:crossover junction endodeoxyribonuclease RuvC [Candidatus Falkowbacteria bacterium]|nr:crossover junction endodeoxyribonuclease RuvC [Candidatus Falkowbacteria bacterium]
MVFLGIDPGIADTGWGIIDAEGSRLKCLAYGSIKTKAGVPVPERLEIIFKELNTLIEQYRPVAAGIEELFFAKNAKTALVVGQARGVALLALHQQKLPIMEFKPVQVKQAVTSYGAADKAQVQRMIKMILCLDKIPKPDDAADALAIAICAATSYRFQIRP